MRPWWRRAGARMRLNLHRLERGPRNPLAVYAVALAALAVALAIRAALTPVLHERLPLVTLYAAVFVAVWAGGWRPALLVAAVGYAAAASWFMADPQRDLSSVFGLASASAFALTCGVIILFGEFMRSAQRSHQRLAEDLQYITDSMAAGVARCSRDLRYVWVSKGYAEPFGAAPEDLEGRAIVDVIGNDAMRELMPHFERVLAGERVRYERAASFVQGGTRWVSVSCSPTRDERGEIDGWIALVYDIDHRRQLEERLRRKNQRLAMLSESAALILHAEDPDAMLRELFARIGPQLGLDLFFNYMRDDTGSGLRLASYSGFSEALASSVERLEIGQAICGRVAQNGQPAVETFIQRSSDPAVQIVKSFGVRAYVCNPMMWGDRLVGTLSFASCSRDHFDPKDVEFLRTITHYVAVAYERVRYIAALRGADRRKDEFLATLAHELRNPLAPLRNALELMRRAPDDAAVIEECRKKMDRQLTHLVRLVDDLLDVNRITHDRLELRMASTELRSLLREAIESIRPIAESYGLRIDTELPNQPIWLQADRVRMVQVFTNLLNNACKFSDPGGRIVVSATSGAGTTEVRVRDFGCGIPPEKLGLVFDMFGQVDRMAPGSRGGFGIGLALVKRLVELHGGGVSAASEGEGRGSEFTVHLPTLAERAPAELPLEAPARALPGSRRMLIVDDNHDAAESLAMLLRMAGNEVHVAHNGNDAFGIAEAVVPDAIILDIGLPDLNGYDVCRRIREQPWGRDITLVALTGWGQHEDRQRSGTAGFDAHLVKPVDYAALVAVLEQCETGGGELQIARRGAG